MPANLLILTSAQDEATSIVQNLRDGGIEALGTRAGNHRFGDALLRTQAFDLIICCGHDPQVDLDACMARYSELTVAPPLIVIADKRSDPRSLFGAMRKGATELMEQGDTEHLRAAVTRALSDLELRHRPDRRNNGKPESGNLPPGKTLHQVVKGGRGRAADTEEREFVPHILSALEGDQFRLVYQPIVSLRGDSQEHYSILLRLPDTRNRLREAKEFLAAAVQSGQMVAIDRWVIRHAIAQIAMQVKRSRKVNCFVNIAAETLQEEGLLVWICDYLREYEVRGNWLTIQIAQDHALRHAAAFARLQDGLRKVKCRTALNRCGLGPESRDVFKATGVDYARLAPSLCVGLADDAARQEPLVAFAEAAKDTGVLSVVPQVEDPRTLSLLWRTGIAYAQGNFLQAPAPSIDLE